MTPFLIEGRDSVTLSRCNVDELKPGDVVMALAGNQDTVVLHRIIAREGEWLTLQGDGNPLITEKANVNDVVGIAVSFVRKGKTYEADSLPWRAFSSFWMSSARLRRFARKLHWRTAFMGQTTSGHRKGIFLSCLIGIISVALSLLFIYLSKLLIDTATGHAQSAPLQTCALLLILIVVLQLLCDAIDSWNGVRVQIGAGNALRHRLFTRILQSEWSGPARFHTGDMVNRIERDTSSVVNLLTVSLPNFVIMGIQLMAAMVFFCYLDTWLPLIIIGVFPFLLIGSRFYMRRMYRYTHKIRNTDSRIQSIIQESLQQRTVIKALEQDEQHIGKLDEQQTLLKKQFMRRTYFSISSRTCVSAAFACGYLIAFLWGIDGLSKGIITFGTMAAFLQLVGKIQRPLLDLARMIPSLTEAITSIDRLRELETMPAESKEKAVCFDSTPDVVIKNVTFRYAQGDRPVFRDFSCRFAAGSRVAIVGQTGKGKTTLVRLLLALVSPEQGSISLSGGGLTMPVSPQTRCNFTYVPQGNTLFSGTIRENLLMGNPSASDKDMRQALHTAMADFVFSYPDQLDTLVGEQGGGLSEGQAQRIAIARALLRNSHIILLDEATSALDEDTERGLVANLEREYAGKTFVFITHHTAVSAKCDFVIQID